MEGQEITIVIRKSSSDVGLVATTYLDGVPVISSNGNNLQSLLNHTSYQCELVNLKIANDWSTKFRI